MSPFPFSFPLSRKKVEGSGIKSACLDFFFLKSVQNLIRGNWIKISGERIRGGSEGNEHGCSSPPSSLT